MLDLTAKDRPWIAADTFLWSIIEVNTGLICACVPVLKPLFRHVVPKSLVDASWSFGKRKVSWSGATLKDDRPHKRRSYIELEHRKAVSQGTMTSEHIGQRTLEESWSRNDPRNDQMYGSEDV